MLYCVKTTIVAKLIVVMKSLSVKVPKVDESSFVCFSPFQFYSNTARIALFGGLHTIFKMNLGI